MAPSGGTLKVPVPVPLNPEPLHGGTGDPIAGWHVFLTRALGLCNLARVGAWLYQPSWRRALICSHKGQGPGLFLFLFFFDRID